MLSCFTKGHFVSLIPTLFAVHFICSVCAFWFSEHDSCLLSYSANVQMEKRSNGLTDWKWKKGSFLPWRVWLFKECTDFLAHREQCDVMRHQRIERNSGCSPYILFRKIFFFLLLTEIKPFSRLSLNNRETQNVRSRLALQDNWV